MMSPRAALLKKTPAIAGLVVGACAVYDPSLLEGSGKIATGGSGASDARAGSDAGGSAGTALNDAGGSGGAASTDAGGAANADADADQTCMPRVVPKNIFGAPTGGVGSIYVALSDLNLGDNPRVLGGTIYRSLGYDQDALCSPTGQSSCPKPTWPPFFEADGPGGVDNTAGALFEKLGDLSAVDASDEYTRRIRDGRGTLFLRIEGYNGEADDGLVNVSVARTLPATLPAWAGIDEWILASDDHLGSMNMPKYRDQNAYVTGSILVARFPSLVVRLMNSDVPLDIALSRVFLSCRLEPYVGIQEFRAAGCVLVGAWHYKDMLARLGSFSVSARPICRDHAEYGSLRSLVCGNVDLTAVDGSSSSCDALSFGIGFETIPAFPNTQMLGALPGVPNRCAGSQDPAQDDCL